MKHVFILNPVAGKKSAALTMRGRIDAFFHRHPEMEYAIYLTDGPGAATRISSEQCAAGVPVRLYACGGDGTLQETANGVPVGSSAEIAVIPCGSGNDYVRIFGGKEAFLDLEDLINGSAITVDAVDCGDRKSLNVASIGMDAKVCANMIRYKNLPGVNGSLAYELAIVDTFCHPIGDEMSITIDGEEGTVSRNGKYLLALAANGKYYGGGYCGAPHAVEDDGVLDFVLVKKIPRLKIPAFLKKYKAGAYDDLPFCEHIRGTAMKVITKLPTFCNIDGECTNSDHMSFTLLPKAFRFVLPASVFEKRKRTAAVPAL